jgi:acetyl esterase
MAAQLDPQAKAFLAELKANQPRNHSGNSVSSYAEQIAAFRSRMRDAIPAAGIPEPVHKIEDFTIRGPAGKIPVRTYLPVAGQCLPVLVYFHGGGFNGGDLDTHDIMLRALANRVKCVIVSVDYRLAPEHPYPAAVEDTWAALEWVGGHANKIGADPQRVAVGGDSAGGCLAALAAQRARQAGMTPMVQILIYPAMDLSMASDSWKEFANDHPLTFNQTLAWMKAYLPPEVERNDPRVSPLFAADVSRVAPALIVTAECDPLRDEGEAYAVRLQAANVPVEYVCYPGMIHGFASLAGVIDAGKRVIDQVAAALRSAFESVGCRKDFVT